MAIVLTKIKTSRFPNRVYLDFSNGLFLPFSLDDLVMCKLVKGLEIDGTKLDQIIHTSLIYLLRESGLRKIATSPKSSNQLKLKLNIALKKYLQKFNLNNYQINNSQLIDEVINYFVERNLLNQNSFIEYFVNKNKHKSRREIIFLLEKQGIKKEIFEALLPVINEQENIKKNLLKKKFDKTKLSDFNYKNKIMAFLFRKGFSLSDIRMAIDDFNNFR